MTGKPASSLQDLRRRIYVKAKAEPSWRFWGLYVHVYKMETLREAYCLARKNNGAPGIDGVTFEQVESDGVESFLQQIQDELGQRTYRPMRVRKKAIPKDENKVRILSIPTLRNRVVQGALKLILEPIFKHSFSFSCCCAGRCLESCRRPRPERLCRYPVCLQEWFGRPPACPGLNC